MVVADQGTPTGPPDVSALVRDLRDPLGAILEAGARLRDGAGSMDQRDAHAILCAGAMLQSILDAALHGLSHDEAPPGDWAEFDLASLCRGAAGTARAMGLGLSCSFGSGIDRVRGDERALRRLIEALVVTAGLGQHAAKIVLRTRALAGRPRRYEMICESDTPGRPVLECVMHSGLWLCRRIAAAHGGWLEARTSAGHATMMVAVLRSDLHGPRPCSAPEEITVVDRELVADPPVAA
jgi:hypothetical protein